MATTTVKRQAETLAKKKALEEQIAKNKARTTTARDKLKKLKTKGELPKLLATFNKENGGEYSLNNQYLLALQGATPGIFIAYYKMKKLARTNGWTWDAEKVYEVRNFQKIKAKDEDEDDKAYYGRGLVINVDDVEGYTTETNVTVNETTDEDDLPF